MPAKVTPHEVKRALVDYFEGKAMHREELADRYDDRRSADCAGALCSVAEHIKSLSDDDALLARLADIRILFGDADLQPLFIDGVFDPPRDVVIAQASAARGGYDVDRAFGECYCDLPSQSDDEAFQCGFHQRINPPEWFEKWVKLVEREANWPPDW